MAGKTTNINSRRNKVQMNIGIIIFGIIFVYLLATIVRFLLTDKIPVYEVLNGSILNDTTYQGFIIREEAIVSSEGDGFINFYVPDDTKVSIGQNIYALSQEALPENNATDTAENLSKYNQEAATLTLRSYGEYFSPGHFSSTYTLKNDLISILDNNTSSNRVQQLNDLLASGETDNITVIPAAKDGIVVFKTDGLEDMKKEDVTLESFDKVTYNENEMRNNDSIKKGEPAYKLILGEKWSIVVPLTTEEAFKYIQLMTSEKTGTSSNVAKVRFLKDNKTFTASFSMSQEENGIIFCYFDFSQAMIRYAKERFVDIELMPDVKSGLKIPKSAITEKESVTVPLDYLTKDANGVGENVLIVGDDSKTATLTTVEVYYKDTSNNIAYINHRYFNTTDKVQKPISQDEQTPSENIYHTPERGNLSGVYNVNKGYAVFMPVIILDENDEYCIVESGNTYSLSQYDYIALDSSQVSEADVIIS